jgi:hypothetical protein
MINMDRSQVGVGEASMYKMTKVYKINYFNIINI